MRTIYYQDGPAGSGKTYALAHWAVDMAKKHEKVLIAQPTKELIRDTYNQIKAYDASIPVKRIHTNLKIHGITKNIMEHMHKAAPHNGEILLITHEALKAVPEGYREFWHLVCDEIPSILDHIDLRIAKTHQHITDYIDTSDESGAFLILDANDKTAMEDIKANKEDDQNIASYRKLASDILAKDKIVLVDKTAYNDLLNDQTNKGHIDIFSITTPDFVADYKSVTFLGANFVDTELYVVWKALLDVNWIEHADLSKSLRYTTHTNGNRLTLKYLFDRNMSKRFLDRDDDDGKVFDQLTDFIKRFFNGSPFLWQVNANQYPIGFDYNYKLPSVAHGLDRDIYKRVDNVALLSALNRKTAAYKFLKKIGVNETKAQATVSWQNDYQAMMRCSLRNPDAVSDVKVIVGSREGAEWIAKKFPGCKVEKLDTDIKEQKPRGRPEIDPKDSKAKTAAERMKEYRARKRAAAYDKRQADKKSKG